MRQHLALPRSTKCCPLSYKDIQLHFMTKEAYLCSNPNYGKATTSIEPLLILWGAGFPATIPVISLMLTVRSAKNYFPLIFSLVTLILLSFRDYTTYSSTIYYLFSELFNFFPLLSSHRSLTVSLIASSTYLQVKFSGNCTSFQ